MGFNVQRGIQGALVGVRNNYQEAQNQQREYDKMNMLAATEMKKQKELSLWNREQGVKANEEDYQTGLLRQGAADERAVTTEEAAYQRDLGRKGAEREGNQANAKEDAMNTAQNANDATFAVLEQNIDKMYPDATPEEKQSVLRQAMGLESKKGALTAKDKTELIKIAFDQTATEMENVSVEMAEEYMANNKSKLTGLAALEEYKRMALDKNHSIIMEKFTGTASTKKLTDGQVQKALETEEAPGLLKEPNSYTPDVSAQQAAMAQASGGSIPEEAEKDLGTRKAPWSGLFTDYEPMTPEKREKRREEARRKAAEGR